MNLAKIFGIGKKDEESNSTLGTLFAAIEEMTTGKDLDEVKLIAGWAGLLGKAAWADMDLDAVEIDRIHRTLVDAHHMDSRTAQIIADLFVEKRSELLTMEDHLYARMINDVASRDQKLELLTTLYKVAAADDTIRETEDATIRTISIALRLSHTDFIEVRRKFKDKLAVFQG